MGSFCKWRDLGDLLMEWSVFPRIVLADTRNKADILLEKN